MTADKSEIARAICCPEGCQYLGDSEDGSLCFCDTSDYRGSKVRRATDVITALQSDSRMVPLATLQWWRQLVDLNPQDLAPRLDAFIADKPTALQSGKLSDAFAMSLRSIANRERSHNDNPELANIIDWAANEIDRLTALQSDDMIQHELIIGNEAAKQALENRRLRALGVDGPTALQSDRATILEEAAKVAENFPARLLSMWERPGGPPGNGYVGVNGQAYIAQAIRALIADHHTATCPKCQRTRNDWDCAEDNCPMATPIADKPKGDET